MKNTVTCPNCEMGNAYFEGTCYTCPDCDYEWGEISTNIQNTFLLNNNGCYDMLTNLSKPFFTLKHGKLYKCKIELEHDIEEATIIPLAFEKNKNRQFVMFDAERLFKLNPTYIHEIVKMDFEYIWNDGIRSNYPFDYEALTVLCTTQEDNTLLEFSGMIFFDFQETIDL